MINKIIDGISVAINSEFGDIHEIYTNGVEQGLTDGSFSIRCLNPTINQKLGNRYFRTNLFCIHYFPKSDERQSECHAVTERLIDCLEYITVDGDLCRGTNMHSEVMDDVLSFFVNYDMFVYKESIPEPTMETFIHNTNVKGL
jgi:hypothetical protein